MMNVKAPANKCVRRGCKHTVTTIGYKRDRRRGDSSVPTSSRTSYATALCLTCRRDWNHPRIRKELILTCTICKTSIIVKQKMGGVRMTCSPACAKKRMSILSKERYRKANPIIKKRCDLCNKKFTKEQVKKSERKYCSTKCLKEAAAKTRKLKRFYKTHLIYIKSTLSWLSTK